MGDIFREIDEELKQERLEKFWRQYGKYVIAGAIVVVAAVAGYQGWEQYQRGQREAEGARFSAALKVAGDNKTADAEAMFAALARDTTSGYGVLARLQQGALKAKAGDRAGAVAVYDAMAADTAIDLPLRNLAILLSAFQQIGDPKADAAALRARVQPLTVGKAAWRFSAQEILALLALKEGKPADARKLYQNIADDTEAPRGIRARATQMLAVIGS